MEMTSSWQDDMIWVKCYDSFPARARATKFRYWDKKDAYLSTSDQIKGN